MKPISVLIADDEESIRALLEHWLKEARHDVVVAANANEAYVAITKRSFDLVITDILMPDGDGLDLIAKLKAAQPKTRILRDFRRRPLGRGR